MYYFKLNSLHFICKYCNLMTIVNKTGHHITDILPYMEN